MIRVVQQRGHEVARNEPDFFRGEIARGGADDIAIILYTSGTTGRPKGVVLSIDNLITIAKNAIEFEGLTDREDVLGYLPMAWIGEHIFSYAQAYCAGFCASSARNRRRQSWPICANSARPLLRAAARLREYADPGYDSDGRRRMVKRKLFHYFQW